MFRPSKTVTVGFLTGVVLLRGTVQAQVTTTTTTTTTTTLLPHPFRPATRECIRNARQTYSCHGAPGSCSSAFQTAYAQCFAGNAGANCATKCQTNESKCLTAVPKTHRTCSTACRTSHKNDVNACRLLANGVHIWASADQGCLITADQNFGNCKFQCSKPEQRMVCHTNFTFCIANCPNL
jgi:hypothetical protein